jgi:hypothetical protein
MATAGGVASYVELLTCLEMARDVNMPTRVRSIRKRQMRYGYAPPE